METFDPGRYLQFTPLPMDGYQIVVIGTGGTGGYVVRDIGRLIYALKEKKHIGLTLVDGDMVEQKNLIRQNFLEDDIGQNKAEVLAERYSAAYGITIDSVAKMIDCESLRVILGEIQREGKIPIVVGCVDNNEARRNIRKAVEDSHYYWVDSGNEEKSGQVIMSMTNALTDIRKKIPDVIDLYKEISDPAKDPKTVVSCAERAERDIQNIFVNLTAATHVMNFLNVIINCKRTFIHGVRFNISGASTPHYVER